MGTREDFFRALANSDKEFEFYVLSASDLSVAIWVRSDSDAATRLQEAQGRYKSIGGPYTARLDRPGFPEQRPDLHVFMKGRELFAMYSDGTRKHGKPGYRIPNRVASGIRKHYPDFEIPDDQILEVTEERGLPILTEEA